VWFLGKIAWTPLEGIQWRIYRRAEFWQDLDRMGALDVEKTGM
jgi:hypothetical protein